MSRSGDYDGEDSFDNEWAFWQHRSQQVLSSRRGYKALSDLRDALLALPEKRLIARALSTVGKEEEAAQERWGDATEILAEQGAGVCAVGAYAWYQRVKGGMDPHEAMASLPFAPDYDDPYRTVEVGRDHGMRETLAMIVMDVNDERFGGATPEQRYADVLAWVEDKLAAFPEQVRSTSQAAV